MKRLTLIAIAMLAVSFSGCRSVFREPSAAQRAEIERADTAARTPDLAQRNADNSELTRRMIEGKEYPRTR